MRILDLFSGLEGWSRLHRWRHEVCSVDIEERFGPDITADILEPELADRVLQVLGGRPDIVLASPPCEAFSVMTIGKRWTPDHQPRDDKARHAVRLVERTRELIEELAPAFYVLENPRAKLRALPTLADLENREVTYCRLGAVYMKPTDLWGVFPPSLDLPRPCPGGDSTQMFEDREWVVARDTGRRCHISAPRGSRTGTQGDLAATAGGSQKRRDLSAERAKVPEMLSRLVVDAAEADLEAGAAPVPTRLF